MAASPIADDVLAFLDRTISSIDQLEILLLVRAQRSKSWTAQQVADELRSNAEAVEERLRMLEAAALVSRAGESPSTFRYEPLPPARDEVIGRLEIAYRDFRFRVIERVFKKPDGMQSFADAFRFRKDRS